MVTLASGAIISLLAIAAGTGDGLMSHTLLLVAVANTVGAPPTS